MEARLSLSAGVKKFVRSVPKFGNFVHGFPHPRLDQRGPLVMMIPLDGWGVVERSLREKPIMKSHSAAPTACALSSATKSRNSMKRHNFATAGASPQEALANQLAITVDQAAVILGIGRNQVYEGVKAGEIPSIRVGSRIILPTAPLRKMLGLDIDQSVADR